jgi:hypothetical protein
VEVLEPSLDDLYRHLSGRNADVLSREPDAVGAKP